MRIFAVAEKPSAAKSIASLLSNDRFTTRNTTSKYNKIYEFTATIANIQCDMRVFSVSGHIWTLEFPSQYQSWERTDSRELFDCPVNEEVAKSMKSIVSTISKEVKSATHVYVATDADREGEFIGFCVAETARNSRQNVVIKRPRFNALTEDAIYNAFASPGELDLMAAQAVSCRRELDLRIGCAFTRLLTQRFAQLSPGSKVLSYGCCQTPCLQLIVDAYLANRNFVPESFWLIKTTLQQGSILKWKRNHLFNKNAVIALLLDVLERSSNGALVEDAATTELSNSVPLPLTTVDLQKSMASLNRFTAKQTLDAAEKLYLKGLISYPRTETNKIVNLQTVKQHLRTFRSLTNTPWSFLITQAITNDNLPKSGNKSDGAHEPIFPARLPRTNEISTLNAIEQKVYEFIFRRFLCLFFEKATAQKTTYSLRIGLESFYLEATRLVNAGYLCCLPNISWPSNQSNVVLTVGQSYAISSIDMEEGKTRAPPLLSESALIALMERREIGTDATIAQHIETNIERGYVTRDRSNTITPTPVGLSLIAGLKAIGLEISDTFIRSQMENLVAQVAAASVEKLEVVEAFVESFRTAFDHLLANTNQFASSFTAELGNNGTQVPDIAPFNSIAQHSPPSIERFSKCRCGGDMSCSKLLTEYNLTCSSCGTSLLVRIGSCLRLEKLEPPVLCFCGFSAVKKITSSNVEVPLCPKCHGESSSQCCFGCFHDTCPLAIKNRDKLSLFECGKCRLRSDPKMGCMRLLKGRANGTKFLGCTSYPRCKNSYFMDCFNEWTPLKPCEKCNDAYYCIVRMQNGVEACSGGCDGYSFFNDLKIFNPNIDIKRPPNNPRSNVIPSSATSQVNSTRPPPLPSLNRPPVLRPVSFLPPPSNVHRTPVLSATPLVPLQSTVASQDGPLRTRKCSHCKNPGHDKRTCPQLR
ncbi:hypothetical protein RCL1_002530 [Eukaryota sp. TZLM3-RCL]